MLKSTVFLSSFGACSEIPCNRHLKLVDMPGVGIGLAEFERRRWVEYPAPVRIYDVVSDLHGGRLLWLLLRCEDGDQFPVDYFDKRQEAIEMMHVLQQSIDRLYR
jgi:hypothetical protein